MLIASSTSSKNFDKQFDKKEKLQILMNFHFSRLIFSCSAHHLAVELLV